jgi:hypothetical protein
VNDIAGWVGERLGVRLVDRPGDIALTDLGRPRGAAQPAGAPTWWSPTVLGKHIPVAPRLCYAAGRLLGERAAAALGGPGRPDLPAAFLAALRATRKSRPSWPRRRSRGGGAGRAAGGRYAETATALGHAVADAFAGARYLHSTRARCPASPRPDVRRGAQPRHRAPAAAGRPVVAAQTAPVVLVDDELTTGRTARGHDPRPAPALPARRTTWWRPCCDLRTAAERTFSTTSARAGVRIDVVSLAGGEVALPPDVLRRPPTSSPDLEPAAPAAAPAQRPAPRARP